MKLQEVNQYRRIEPLNICSFSDWFKTESWISQDEDILSRPVRELKHLHVPNIHLANTLRKTAHSACMDGSFFTSQFGALENV